MWSAAALVDGPVVAGVDRLVVVQAGVEVVQFGAVAVG